MTRPARISSGWSSGWQTTRVDWPGLQKAYLAALEAGDYPEAARLAVHLQTRQVKSAPPPRPRD